MLPWTRVVLESKLIHHDDAFFDRTNLGTFAAADAVLIVDVIKAVRGRVEALVRAFGPAERALGTEIEPDCRSLRLGGAALHRRNYRSLLHLEPFGQYGNFVGPFDSIVRGNRSDSRRLGLLAQRFVRCARGVRPVL